MCMPNEGLVWRLLLMAVSNSMWCAVMIQGDVRGGRKRHSFNFYFGMETGMCEFLWLL